MGCLNDEAHAPEVSVDTVFEVLADRRRRYILCHLRDSSESAMVFDELVAFVTAQEPESADRDREQVAAHLHHVAVPKLADVGLIEYDARSETVRYRRHSLVETCLDHTETCTQLSSC